MYALLSQEGNLYLIEKPGRYNYEEGIVEIKEHHLDNIPSYVVSSKGIRFVLFKPYDIDLFERSFRRHAQIIHEKDLGYLMRRLSLNKNAVLLESGSGSGHATIFLSKLFKHIDSYEKDRRFYETTKRNISLFRVDNITLHHKDVITCSKTSYYDAVLFDFKEACREKYIEKAKEVLKPGGVVIMYFPVVEQVAEAIENLEQRGFVNIHVREILLREWKTKPLRPKNIMLGHTAFLIEARKI